MPNLTLKEAEEEFLEYSEKWEEEKLGFKGNEKKELAKTTVTAEVVVEETVTPYTNGPWDRWAYEKNFPQKQGQNSPTEKITKKSKKPAEKSVGENLEEISAEARRGEIQAKAENDMRVVAFTKNDLATLDNLIEENLEDWSWEEFLSAGIVARELKDFSQWVLGHIALGVEKKYGENTLGMFAKEVGVSPNSLRVYRWVVKQFGVEYFKKQKTNHLPFSAYTACAGTEDPIEWVEKAVDNDWTINQLRYEIKDLQLPKTCTHKWVQVWRCEKCGKTSRENPLEEKD